MVAKEVSLNVKTKATFKYDCPRDFLLCLNNLQTTETLKKTRNS